MINWITIIRQLESLPCKNEWTKCAKVTQHKTILWLRLSGCIFVFTFFTVFFMVKLWLDKNHWVFGFVHFDVSILILIRWFMRLLAANCWWVNEMKLNWLKKTLRFLCDVFVLFWNIKRETKNYEKWWKEKVVIVEWRVGNYNWLR